jgi:hypothetical protein
VWEGEGEAGGFLCRITSICSLSLGFCMEKRDVTAQGCVIRLRVNFLTSQHIPLPPQPSPALYCSPRACLAKHYRLRHHPMESPTTLGCTRIDHAFLRYMNTECMPYISYFSYHRPLYYLLTYLLTYSMEQSTS